MAKATITILLAVCSMLVVDLVLAASLNSLPWGSPCRQQVDNFGRKMGLTSFTLDVNKDCDVGKVEWHYPKERDTLEVTWKRPGGEFRVCLDRYSLMFSLTQAYDITNGRNVPIQVPESVQGDDNSAYAACISSINQEVKLRFKSDAWTYMQLISFEIKSV